MNKRKCIVKDLQVLTGYLNFLTKAIFAERMFTHRMYVKYSGCLDENAVYRKNASREKKQLKLFLMCALTVNSNWTAQFGVPS